MVTKIWRPHHEIIAPYVQVRKGIMSLLLVLMMPHMQENATDRQDQTNMLCQLLRSWGIKMHNANKLVVCGLILNTASITS